MEFIVRRVVIARGLRAKDTHRLPRDVDVDCPLEVPPRRYASAQLKSHATLIRCITIDRQVASVLDSYQLDENRYMLRLREGRPVTARCSSRVEACFSSFFSTTGKHICRGEASFEVLYVNVNVKSGHLIIDVDRVEASRTHEAPDLLRRPSAMRRPVILRPDLARCDRGKQSNDPICLVARRRIAALLTLGGMACA